jgi:Mg2+/Co2+ transporter CorB
MSYLLSAGIGFAALLYFSGFFSGSETAFFSLSKLDLGEMPPGSRVRRLMDKPEKLLIAILVGNTLVNVAAARSLPRCTRCSGTSTSPAGTRVFCPSS